MRKTNEGRSPAGILLPSAAAGVLTTLFLMLVGAVFVQRGTLEDGLIAGRFGARRLGGRQYAQEKALQSFEKVGGNYHEACIHADLCHPEADRGPRRLRRMPDFLPVRLQDLLHGGQPEV